MIRFDVHATNFCKEIACLLLLAHHMVYFNPGEFGRVITAFDNYSKVCVALYCLLSGYGLAVSSGTRGFSEFIVIRLSKLYIGFWSVAIVFIPISWLLFDRGITQVFTGEHLWLQLLAQLLGLQGYFRLTGFCGPWGFMSIILTLYLAFPILQRGCKKHPAITLVACYAFLFLPTLMAYRIFPFALGIFAAQNDLFAKWSRFSQIGMSGKFLYNAFIPDWRDYSLHSTENPAFWRIASRRLFLRLDHPLCGNRLRSHGHSQMLTVRETWDDLTWKA